MQNAPRKFVRGELCRPSGTCFCWPLFTQNLSPGLKGFAALRLYFVICRSFNEQVRLHDQIVFAAHDGVLHFFEIVLDHVEAVDTAFEIF